MIVQTETLQAHNMFLLPSLDKAIMFIVTWLFDKFGLTADEVKALIG